MPIGTITGTANTSGGSNASSISLTRPTCADGDLLHLFASESTGSLTMTTPTGWTLKDGPVDDGANTLRGYWFTKTAVAATDSGTSLTIQWSGSGRIAAGCVKVPGASGFDVVQAAVVDATADGQIDIPAITPGVDDAARIVLVLTRYAAGTAGAMSTVPTGFTKLFDVATSNASSPRLGAIGLAQQLTGQSGVSQAAVSGFYNNSVTRNTFWQFTVAPTATSTTYQASGTAAGTSAVAGAVTAVLLAAGTVAGVSGVSGAVTRVPRVYSAAGTVAATSTTTGAVTGILGASGTVATSSTVTGNPTALHQVTGTATATSGTSGAVTSLLPTSGTTAASSSASGAVTALRPASGTTTTTSGVAGAVTATLRAAGTVTAVSGATGSVSVLGGPQTYPAAGTVTVASSTSGTITARLVAAGSTNATSTNTGAVTAILTTAGTVSAVSDVSGDPSLIAGPVVYQAAGTVEAVSGVTGSVTQTSPSDGTPVPNPTLILDDHDRMLTLTVPDRGLDVASHDRTLTLTVPPSTLELG